MSIPQPWRAAAFAKKRMAASVPACGGSVSRAAWLPSGRYLNAQYPLRSGLWHPLNVPLPPAPLRAAGSSMADARSAAQPSSPPRSPLGQQSRRLSKRAFKRTAQPAGPTPCWRPPLGGGLGGSGTFKGCQRPFRRGNSAFENRPDDSDATCETDPPQAEVLATIRFFANAAARQGSGSLMSQHQPSSARWPGASSIEFVT